MMNHHTLISVIIPVYNVSAFLRPCLDSLVAQTYPHFEVLLVDDGSTDDSGAICDDYAERDPRFRVFHKENGGISSARNLAMDYATGEYISFIDSDDRLTPDHFEVLFADIEKHHVRAAFCNYALIDTTGAYLPLESPRFTECTRLDTIDDMLRYATRLSVVWGCLLPADITLRYRFSTLRYGEDSYFMYDLLCNNFPVYLDTYTGYLYLQRPSSVTATTTVPEVLKLRDHLLVHAHRYLHLPPTAPAIRNTFLQTYALYIHNLAYTIAQPENEAHRAICKPVVDEHIKKVLPLCKELSTKLKLTLQLYTYAPVLYNAYARFNERKRRK